MIIAGQADLYLRVGLIAKQRSKGSALQGIPAGHQAQIPGQFSQLALADDIHPVEAFVEAANGREDGDEIAQCALVDD